MKKKVGFGTISGVFFLFAILFSFTVNGFTIGDALLAFMNQKAWSNATGFHYTIVYSSLILVMSFVIGEKFPEDIGAICLHKMKRILFLFFLLILFVFILINTNVP